MSVNVHSVAPARIELLGGMSFFMREREERREGTAWNWRMGHIYPCRS